MLFSSGGFLCGVIIFGQNGLSADVDENHVAVCSVGPFIAQESNWSTYLNCI